MNTLDVLTRCLRRTSVRDALLLTSSLTAVLALFGTAPSFAQSINGGAVVTVPGSQASPWIIPGSLAVGDTSTGTLNISSGGVVSSGSGFIGRQITGIGTVTVSGAGAQWTSGPGLSVGNFGNGTLSIADGGHVSSTTNSYIGVALGSIGAVTVSGVGSRWDTSGFLRVGQTGTGTLAITGGAVVSNGLGYVGYDATGNGIVTVSGVGSQWSNSSGLTVGVSGIGKLNITNGGLVTDTVGAIGSGANSTGTVAVDGAGSRWTNSGALTVGNSGNGALTISNDGVVSAVSANVAVNSGSHGIINIGAAAANSATAPGTLMLTGLSPSLALGANGSLVFNHTSGSYQFTPGVTGAGKVEAYNGTTILTGTSTYSGGTTIAPAAILQLGNSGTTGSIVGNVANNGALTFNRSDTVTFAGVISGIGVVNHNGAGTTVLTANNTYSGITTISAGTLQLGNGGTSGSIVSDVVNNAALTFNRSDIYTYSGSISSTGIVNQIGTGTTIFTSASNTYSGATNVNTGTLQAGTANTFSPNSPVNVAAVGTLDLNGFNQIVPGVTNAGLINMGIGTPPGTTLTTSNYVGAGGTIALNTYLGSDGSPSDRLIINGGTATGNSFLRITNSLGPGDVTNGNGILVVDTTNGGATASGAFALSGPAVAGPYEYTLYRSSVDATNPQAWYLRSTLNCSTPGAPSPPCPAPPVPPTPTPPNPPTPPTPPEPVIPNYRAETSLYAALPAMALGYGRTIIDTLHQRVGEQQPGIAPGGGRGLEPSLGWARFIGLHGNREGSPIGIYGNGPKYDYDILAFQGGLDLYRSERANGGRDHIGVYAAVGQITADVTHFNRSKVGKDRIDAYSVGAYWTQFGANGWYTDAIAQYTWNDVKAASLRLPTLRTDGSSLGLSLESGYPVPLGAGWQIEPQAQIIYQKVWLGDAIEPAATIRFTDAQSLAGRVGARVSRSWLLDNGNGTGTRIMTAWIRPNIWYEFFGNPRTEFSSADGFIPFRASLRGGWFEINGGLDAQVVRNVSLVANASYQHGFDGRSHAYHGRLGVRVNW